MNKNIIKKGVIFLTSLMLLLYFLIAARTQYQESIQASIAQKVIRFHVIANSDSQEDQSLKLKVRDGINQYMQGLLGDVDSIEESRQVIKSNLYEITLKANEILKNEGAPYRAVASLGMSEFPQKEYDKITFPAGEYEALKIVLGKGDGHNWWCVMYPNLCFSDAIYKWNTKEWTKLKKTLTPREYEKIMENKNYTIRWKFLEYFWKRG